MAFSTSRVWSDGAFLSVKRWCLLHEPESYDANDSFLFSARATESERMRLANATHTSCTDARFTSMPDSSSTPNALSMLTADASCASSVVMESSACCTRPKENLS